MDVDARVEAWASLQLLPGLGPRSLVPLLKAFGGAADLRAASRAQLAKYASPEVAAAIARGPNRPQLERTLAWLREPGHWLLAWDDPDYPPALLAIADPPPVFCYAGRRELLSRAALAIVGSRNATPQGVEHATEFGAALSAAGLTIVSGLATGIDAAAHRGGLSASGSSVAIVGTGLDRVYPPENDALAQRLAQEGGLLSEFSLGTPPLPENFPRRNRVISGLSRGVLVVEATLNSGSLITAKLAAEQGREVFAVPGSINSPFSKGTHRLIREGAKLVETAQDVLDELNIRGVGRVAGSTAAADDDTAMTAAQKSLLAAIAHDPVDLDTLIARTQMSADAIAAALTTLELDGRIAALPGGRWQRVASRTRA